MLTWQQLNVEKRLITTRRFKTGNPGQVPICDRLAMVFRGIKVREIGGSLFPGGIKPRQVSTAILRAFSEAGLRGFGAKSLRHFAATILFEGGITQEQVGQTLGHSPNSPMRRLPIFAKKYEK